MLLKYIALKSSKGSLIIYQCWWSGVMGSLTFMTTYNNQTTSINDLQPEDTFKRVLCYTSRMSVFCEQI